MPARKTTRKTAKKGGTLDADLTSIAVPFGLLLAKQSLEKLSGTKVKAKTAKRMKRVAVGGSNANVANASNTGNASNSGNVPGNVSGVNTMAPNTGANVGGKSVKKGRGRPRSKVGGNSANAVNATNAVNVINSGNVSGVNTMAPKTGANVGGRRKAKKSTKSKKGGKTTPKKTRKTQKAGTQRQVVPNGDECEAAKRTLDKCPPLQSNNDNANQFTANQITATTTTTAAPQGKPVLDGGKSKAKKSRGRPRKN